MKLLPFTEKQLRVLTFWCDASAEQNYDALICDGAVRSGKTVCMGISFVTWAMRRFSGASFALCGKTITSLKRNVVTPLLSILEGEGFCCRRKISENWIDIVCGKNSNRFYLFGGRDEGSAALIQGMTLAGVLFDEVALMPRSFVEQALARCSVEGSKFWFNCNPEHPGHWFYREWIQKADKRRALYLHFTMQDNPALSKQLRTRYEKLYSGTFYRRFVCGEWTAAEGAVYPFMTEDVFCELPQGRFGRYAVSCDYGTVNPSSFGLWGERAGVWYRIEEYYYDARREGISRTDEEHYRALCALLGDRTPECVVVDPSAASFMEVIRRHGKYRVMPARNQVLDGIRKTAAALQEGKIQICRTCPDAMREFSLYRWESGGRDIPNKENDHAMDDIRYFVSTLLDSCGEDRFCVLSVERGGR